jgi:hypothetical protein
MLPSLARAAALAIATLVPGVATAQSVLFDTGVAGLCVNNGTGGLTYLGWSSGNAGAGFEQRYAAQAFTLPAGEWVVTQLQPRYFLTGAAPTSIGWILYSRTGQTAPTQADEIASGTVPFTVETDPIPVNVPLSGGEYYLTIYGIGGALIGWYTNAQGPDAIPLQDANGYFLWRSAQYPVPGYERYTTSAFSPAPGTDPTKFYCAEFVIRGDPAPYCVDGAGGPIPATGTGDGSYPGTLPSAPLVSMLTLPGNAASIDSVELAGLSHTWAGDLHAVLVDPSGVGHNLMVRPGLNSGTCCGNSGNFLGGSYTIVESGGLAFPDSGDIAAGVYDQRFGTWNSGDSSIFNTPLSAIPVVPGGNYTLHVYDWAGGDVGALSSWRICGQGTDGTTSYCVSTVSLNGCLPTMSSSGMPRVSTMSGFHLMVGGADGMRPGGMFYGLAAAANPFGSATLCTSAPRQRLTGLPVNTGGTPGGCDGGIAVDLGAFLASHPAALGSPFGAGDTIYVQAWNRDNGNGSKNVVTSDGLAVTWLP